jgi:hypothetical protein
MTESNPEQTLADIEAAFEDSKQNRLISKNAWEAAKGKYHMILIARREAGEKLTVADMRALEATAINDVEEVRTGYLDFIEADSKYRAAKEKWEAAKRDYWDKKDMR